MPVTRAPHMCPTLPVFPSKICPWHRLGTETPQTQLPRLSIDP